MIVVAAKALLKPGKRNEFIENAQDCIKKTRQELGNESYTLWASTEDENTVMFFETWTTQADLDAHMKTPHFYALGAATEGLLEKPFEVDIYETL